MIEKRCHCGKLSIPGLKRDVALCQEHFDESMGYTVKENRIVEVKLVWSNKEARWTVTTRKQFAPEYGGGEQTFTIHGGESVHGALDIARGMVTLSPARRTNTAA